MSGVRLPYLERRQGVWTLRVRVPDDVKLRVGLLEVRRSLRTHSSERARRLAATYVARLREVFELARTDQLTKTEAQQRIATLFDRLARETTGYIPKTGDPAEKAEQIALAEERLDEISAQLARQSFDGDIEGIARELLIDAGFQLSAVEHSSFHDVLVGVARALAEQQRLFLFRLEERLLNYQPKDPLFGTPQAPVFALPATVQSVVPEGIGPTAKELCEKYLASKKKSWVRKTYDNRVRQLSLFVEHVGPETRASDISAEKLRTFRDGLLRLRRNHHIGTATSFVDRQTPDEEGRITPKTASLQFETTKGMLRWAKREQYLANDPSLGLSVDMPKTSKTKKARRPFVKKELVALFTSPAFLGCKGPRRRFNPGPLQLRDAFFWLPILGLYTGARLGELVQLHVLDVQLEGDVPFIEITDAESGVVGSGDEKHVKSSAGVRKVPIHSDLLALGFAEFVSKRLADKRASKRLFFEVAFGKDGQASTTFSKWFARLMDKSGLTDPALVFHSFRHTVEDAFRDAKEHQYVIDKIVGHADGATSALYGAGVSLTVAKGAVEGMVLPVRLTELIKTESGKSFAMK